MYINRYCRHFLTYGLSLGLVSIWLSCQVPTSKPPNDDTTATPQGVATVETAPTAAAIDTAIQRAFRYLAASQLEDGSWVYYSSLNESFTSIYRPQPRLTGTIKITLCLQNSPFNTHLAVKKAVQYIADAKENDSYTWSWDTKRHDWYNTLKYYNCLQEPDIDNTVLGAMTTAGYFKLGQKEYIAIKKTIDAYKEKGMYKTFMAGKYGSKACGYYYGNDAISLGLNLDVLGFLDKNQLNSQPLLQSIQQYIAQPRYWEIEPYDKSLFILIDTAADAIAQGSEGAKITLPMLWNSLNHTVPIQLTAMYNIDLAGYLHGGSRLYLLQNTPSKGGLAKAATELLHRQQNNGSWQASRRFLGAVYPDGKKEYFGAEAETTAFALKALLCYQSLLNAH